MTDRLHGVILMNTLLTDFHSPFASYLHSEACLSLDVDVRVALFGIGHGGQGLPPDMISSRHSVGLSWIGYVAQLDTQANSQSQYAYHSGSRSSSSSGDHDKLIRQGLFRNRLKRREVHLPRKP